MQCQMQSLVYFVNYNWLIVKFNVEDILPQPASSNTAQEND